MPSASTPTARQQAYLDYIAAHTHAHQRAPAEADMRHHFGVTAPSVHTMVLTLERRGFITRPVGWGFHDHVAATVATLADELSAP